MIKKISTAIIFCLCTISAFTQITAKWGNIDTRYPVEPGVVIKTTAINKAIAWRGERVNLQLLVSNGKTESKISYQFSDLKCGKHIIPVENIVGGFVQPVITDTYSACRRFHGIHAYGERLSADRITADSITLFEANTSRGLWLTIQVPQHAKPGTYTGSVIICSNNRQIKQNYNIQVIDHLLPEPSQWGFHLDLWQNPYSIARIHQVDLWSSKHFEILRPYMKKLAAGGQKVITATLINRAWDGQAYDAYGSMVTWIRKIDGTWSYDFSIFDRWVEFMMECGIDKEITCFSMIPWKLSFRYYDLATDSHKEVKCTPGEKKYDEFWGGMLKAFSAHLKEKGWIEKTFISMDERRLEHMIAAIKVIKKYAPEIKISMAGLYHPEIESDITDYCLDFENYLAYTPELIARRRSEGKISTYYTCCKPQYPNLFTFSAPAEGEFIALEALARNLDGYLRWAYNSWTEDPEKDSRHVSWSGGDTYIIYPYSISSIRWERLVQGIQQFEKYKILLDEAKSKNDKSYISRLEDLLKCIDINLVEKECERMVNEFRNGLNKF